MVNEVTLIGNITRDPEMKEIEEGKVVANFGLATHRIYRKEGGERVDQTEFHELVAWGKTAQRAGMILRRGRLAYVRGTLKTDHWEKDGQKRSQTRIVVDEFRVLDRPKTADSGEQPDEAA